MRIAHWQRYFKTKSVDLIVIIIMMKLLSLTIQVVELDCGEFHFQKRSHIETISKRRKRNGIENILEANWISLAFWSLFILWIILQLHTVPLQLTIKWPPRTSRLLFAWFVYDIFLLLTFLLNWRISKRLVFWLEHIFSLIDSSTWAFP